ncbi:MAG: translation initiation factor IF-2 [Bacteroidetes bacterium]|nr:translation initiation factor IF-2 [Bacteroidota bacterium]
MSEEKKTYRLFKVAKELNVGMNTLVDFLGAKNLKVDASNPNEKISADIYDLLLNKFGDEKKLKERAEQLRDSQKELKKVLEEPKQREFEETELILTASELKSNLLKQETPPEAPQPVAPEPELPQPKPRKEPEAEIITPAAETAAAEEKPGPKVVGKIDLSQFEKKKKKETEKEKPKAPAQTEPAKAKSADKPVSQEPAPEVSVPQPEPVAEATPEPEPSTSPATAEEAPVELSTIRAKDNAPKLQGLKIMGKIELPTEKKREDKKREAIYTTTKEGEEESEADKRKRKRKRKATGPAATPATTAARPMAGNTGGRGMGSATVGQPNDAGDKLRKTLSDMNRGASRKRQMVRRDKRDKHATQREASEMELLENARVLEVTEFLTANELATLMNINVNQVIAKCMELGLFVSINQRIDKDIISMLAEEFGYEVSFVSADEALEVEEEQEEEGLLSARPPIITVMGHVDHGKTSLLDYIRKANVIAGEAGGITQHIGAYEVTLEAGRKITFLDTPGHEAFTAMRARGAQVTDIAIIIIAADDQVMPQTREAINHAQAAGVPMVFAINKIDKPGANAEKIREQLAGMNLLVEDWGGKYQCQEISAKSGLNIDLLLEKVLLEAELLELKANPNRPARGTVIEAQLDKGRGVVATILVQTGTLKVGDVVVANQYYGRVKAMMDEREKRLTTAGPSTPVQILGLDGVPQAGDKIAVMGSDREARELANKRAQLLREQSIRMTKHMTLEEIARRAAAGDFRELNLIVKGDVDGSVEALSDSLIKLSRDEVMVNIVMKGVGQITESDVLLASASNAIIIGFQVRPSASARKLAVQEEIDIRLYSVIYNAINEIKDAMEGLLSPDIQEEIMGTVEVRDVFRISKVGTVAGCMVIDGKVNRNNPIRLIRDGVVVYGGKILALKRFKDDVKEVAEGFECGLSIENFNDIKVGDLIEAYTTKEVKRTFE